MAGLPSGIAPASRTRCGPAWACCATATACARPSTLADADATEPAATACEPDPITRLENRNLLTVGYVEANAALRRTESRGAHARTDYPESCDEWAQSIAYINA